MTQSEFRLRAIVGVEPQHRVRCQQPHCGHSVYARIHIVEEAGQLLVIGADCFAKRYGISNTAKFKGFGGGSGRALTEDERILLDGNTAALLAQFEEEERVAREREEAALKALRERQAAAHLQRQQIQKRESLWEKNQERMEPAEEENIPQPAWASLKKQNTSFFAYGFGDGQCWVLMQSAQHDGCFIAPAPTAFESWDEALPASIGAVDLDREVYVSTGNINALTGWFSQRCRKGSRIDSDAREIQRFAKKAIQ